MIYPLPKVESVVHVCRAQCEYCEVWYHTVARYYTVLSRLTFHAALSFISSICNGRYALYVMTELTFWKRQFSHIRLNRQT